MYEVILQEEKYAIQTPDQRQSMAFFPAFIKPFLSWLQISAFYIWRMEQGCPAYPFNYLEEWGLLNAIDKNFEVLYLFKK